MTGNKEVEQELVARDEVLASAKRALKKVQGSMKRYYDQNMREVIFESEEYVYLKLQPYRQKSLKKKINVKLS